MPRKILIACIGCPSEVSIGLQDQQMMEDAPELQGWLQLTPASVSNFAHRRSETLCPKCCEKLPAPAILAINAMFVPEELPDQGFGDPRPRGRLQ